MNLFNMSGQFDVLLVATVLLLLHCNAGWTLSCYKQGFDQKKPKLSRCLLPEVDRCIFMYITLHLYESNSCDFETIFNKAVSS